MSLTIDEDSLIKFMAVVLPPTRHVGQARMLQLLSQDVAVRRAVGSLLADAPLDIRRHLASLAEVVFRCVTLPSHGMTDIVPGV